MKANTTINDLYEAAYDYFASVRKYGDDHLVTRMRKSELVRTKEEAKRNGLTGGLIAFYVCHAEEAANGRR